MKVQQKVKCYKCSNELDIDVSIKDKSERKSTSEIEVYCPFCDEWLITEIKGELSSNKTILRGLPKTNKK